MGSTDINMVKTIVRNLVSNAVKFSYEKGSGLGLMLCKDFIEQLGGKLCRRRERHHLLFLLESVESRITNNSAYIKQKEVCQNPLLLHIYYPVIAFRLPFWGYLRNRLHHFNFNTPNSASPKIEEFILEVPNTRLIKIMGTSTIL